MGAELHHLDPADDRSPPDPGSGAPGIDAAIVATRTGTATVPTPHGDFVAHAYRTADGVEHAVLVCGDLDGPEPALVRVHSECLTGDIFHSRRCDCGSQLDEAIRRVAHAGHGAVVYLRGHEGRGIGLGRKLQAYALQDGGLDTVDANAALGFAPDLREYHVAAAILADLGATTVRLLTNNPAKFTGLESHGLTVIEQVPLVGETTPENVRYLETKRDRMGHTLDPVRPDSAADRP